MLRSPRPGRACMALALAAAAWAAATVLTGGFTVGFAHGRLSSRDPLRPLLAALALLILSRLALGPAEFRRLVTRLVGADRGARASRVAAAAAACVLLAA